MRSRSSRGRQPRGEESCDDALVLDALDVGMAGGSYYDVVGCEKENVCGVSQCVSNQAAVEVVA